VGFAVHGKTPFSFISSALRSREKCAKVRDIPGRFRGAGGKKNQAGSHRPDKKERGVPMKKRAFVTATLFVLSLIVAAQVVLADEPMLVNIPFAFVAGNVTLPAASIASRNWTGVPPWS